MVPESCNMGILFYFFSWRVKVQWYGREEHCYVILTFMGPCIVNVFFKNKQQDAMLYNSTVSELLMMSGETAWNM